MSIPSGGPTRYTQSALHAPAPSAEPNERAGFMLAPEIGDSTAMNSATSEAATMPAYRMSRPLPSAVRTASMSTAEIASSATAAAAAPCGPGRVVT
jgi:hypothetical protein